ncbi:MAG: type 2 isopentenyl-diphosphate Delta-isomerase [Candidatus Altiarchaeales archaeon WOR_SM1_86-2]|nr:MAG: type 2 isopentenyl-diphosphate Delta-isomerase [Candidatus Altiarchaeales archaeon WOR_SM1_86-2]ODS41105.1 MAG: type 2 isopentenyl-diphosphate Delta-isomerase [Candidatus Altiarchaeales archaeon WOR_SM1_79]
MAININNRKLEHLKICIEKDVESGSAGFEEVKLAHHSCPEIDFDEINTEIEFFNKRLSYPVIIEGMTGGAHDAEKINKDLAFVAQGLNIGMGVGSQRAAIEDPRTAYTYKVRDVAPDILLLGNLGAVQFNYGYGVKECKQAVEMINADALALHINPLQEVVQIEGEGNFSGLVEKINEIAKELRDDSIKVIVKGVGSGISYDIARRLGVDAVDAAGVGGTSWALVESYRGDKRHRKTGKLFADWGIPTARCVKELSNGSTPVIASGGIRTGVDAAKAIALGADCVGMALPILRAWAKDGRKGVREYLDQFIAEFEIAMFLTASVKVEELKGKVV